MLIQYQAILGFHPLVGYVEDPQAIWRSLLLDRCESETPQTATPACLLLSIGRIVLHSGGCEAIP